MLSQFCGDLFDGQDKKILDVGCDCGIVTCFLARCCPDAEVIGIDRSANAVARARELAEKLGVTNVRFERSTLKDVRETYDVVFCSRVAEDNTVFPISHLYDTFYNLSEEYRKQLKDFLSELTDTLAEDGQLIIGEASGFAPICYAEIRTLIDLGCLPYDGEPVLYKQFEENWDLVLIICQKQKDLSVLENDFARRDTSENAPLLQPYLKTKEDYYARMFFLYLARDRDMSGCECFDWDANIMLEDTAKELIEGYLFYDSHWPHPFVFSLWTNVNDPTAIVYFGPDEKGRKCWNNQDISRKEEMLGVIRSGLHRECRSDSKIMRLTFKDGEVEEEPITINDVPEANMPGMPGPEILDFNPEDWKKH